MDNLRKFTFPLVFVVLLGAFFLIYKIKTHVPGELGTWDIIDLPHEERENGFKTFFPGVDVYTVVLEETQWIIGGSDGVFIQNKKENTVLQSQGLRYVYGLAQTSNGLLIGYDGGILCYDGKNLEELEEFKGRLVRELYPTEAGVWAGTFDGVFLNRELKFNQTNGLADDMVNVILQTSDESLWFGSYVAPRGGISIVQGNKIVIHEDIVHPNITTMYEIAPNVVLTGGGLFDKGGGNVFIKEGDQWDMVQTIVMDDGLPGEKIRSLHVDGEGRLWIGSEFDGVGIYTYEVNGKGIDFEPLLFLKQQDGLASDEIKVITEDDDYYYLGTFKGLSQISKLDMERLIENSK